MHLIIYQFSIDFNLTYTFKVIEVIILHFKLFNSYRKIIDHITNTKYLCLLF